MVTDAGAKAKYEANAKSLITWFGACVILSLSVFAI
jgi:hypothetical protein